MNRLLRALLPGSPLHALHAACCCSPAARLKHDCCGCRTLPAHAPRRRRCPQEFGGGIFQRLPRTLRKGVRDSGICHYLAVFRQKDGSLVQVRRCRGNGSLAAGAEAAGGGLRA